MAAREGRKGLFIAALNQQAKYWRAEAFNAWRRVLLQEKERTDAGPFPDFAVFSFFLRFLCLQILVQDRCQQLKDILESRKKVLFYFFFFLRAQCRDDFLAGGHCH